MIKSDIDQFLQELLDNKERFNIVSYKEELAKKKVLIVEDSDKNQSWIGKLENAESIILESDHNFVDRRIELTNLVVSWLGRT